MTSALSTNTDILPLLAPAKEKTTELLERWQEWSDRHFAGKYRDAAETLICGLILLICYVAIRLYNSSKRCLGKAFGYWLADAEQQFLVESSLWLVQIAFELPPIVRCDMFWRLLEQDEIAQQQILEYELSWACGAETCRRGSNAASHVCRECSDINSRRLRGECMTHSSRKRERSKENVSQAATKLES